MVLSKGKRNCCSSQSRNYDFLMHSSRLRAHATRAATFLVKNYYYLSSIRGNKRIRFHHFNSILSFVSLYSAISKKKWMENERKAFVIVVVELIDNGLDHVSQRKTERASEREIIE